MKYRKTITVTDSDSHEVAVCIAQMANFPKGSKCWEFGKVWTKGRGEDREPDIGGLYVWHRDTVAKYGGPENIAYTIDAEPDIRVTHAGKDEYEVTFTENVPLECVEMITDDYIMQALEKSIKPT